MHALTGWIPERWAIRTNEPDFNKDGLFRNLLKRWPNGDVLVTVATGELSEAVADHTGLVPTHAYAVLDVKQIDVSLSLAILLLMIVFFSPFFFFLNSIIRVLNCCNLKIHGRI